MIRLYASLVQDAATAFIRAVWSVMEKARSTRKNASLASFAQKGNSCKGLLVPERRQKTRKSARNAVVAQQASTSLAQLAGVIQAVIHNAEHAGPADLSRCPLRPWRAPQPGDAGSGADDVPGRPPLSRARPLTSLST